MENISQIGGLPNWFHEEAEYPICSGCGKTMMFVGQLDCLEISDCGATFYAFLCPDCQITATTGECD